ncbi:cation diffusion facilitator family transporter [Brachybacterium sp. ACRRE]|uniref:cation diffusion facilitator family transporter n=1 Tax=Brachybacterium sp. ACRRE TaxID=2918184 RepID=UPI001EF32028|nr:cation diffusion facilitator family transporter [Brachybacterium sp. ACRRE]
MNESRRGEPAPEEVSPSGRDALPEEQERVLARAIRLEWFSLVFLAVTVTMVALVSGQSQAMKAAWLEDSMSLLPPIAFLVAAHLISKRSDRGHPYGHHRSIGVAHVVSAAALLGMGVFLVVDSLSTLITVERPPVGLTVVLGHAFWAGWLMIAVMVVTNIPPIFIGRAKMKLAEPLHDKVLYADADMNKANWTSALATVVGVLGIGAGLWWADSVAALVVSVSILHDGVKNLRSSIRGLTDAEARTFDDKEPHPLIGDIEQKAREADWVADAVSRVRDEGHVFHAEVFVVPAEGAEVTGKRCEELRRALRDVDWKVHDVVIAPVSEIPADQAFRRTVAGSEATS